MACQTLGRTGLNWNWSTKEWVGLPSRRTPKRKYSLSLKIFEILYWSNLSYLTEKRENCIIGASYIHDCSQARAGRKNAQLWSAASALTSDSADCITSGEKAQVITQAKHERPPERIIRPHNATMVSYKDKAWVDIVNIVRVKKAFPR